MRRIVDVDDRLSSAWVQILSGASRTVILCGPLAVKVPRITGGWRAFLRGLIANSIEREWWRDAPEVRDRLCPVRLALPGGWLVVMARCEPVVNVSACYDEFVNRGGLLIPAENKDDSFGWLGGDTGRLVAVDYGG